MDEFSIGDPVDWLTEYITNLSNDIYPTPELLAQKYDDIERNLHVLIVERHMSDEDVESLLGLDKDADRVINHYLENEL